MLKIAIYIFSTVLLLLSWDFSYAKNGLYTKHIFSRARIVSENNEEGQAGKLFRSADTVKSMAEEAFLRTFVYRGDPKKAFLLSLLIPGLGQHYVKSRKATRFFAVVEAALWGTMIGHRLSSRWARQNYKAFATNHARASIDGKDDQYFVDIGNFLDIYRFNNKKQVDRSDDNVLEITPDNFWQWDSDENRSKFRKMRIDADATKNRAVFFTTGIFINHLISAIHATLVAKQGKPIESSQKESHFHISITDHPRNSSPVVTASYIRNW